MLFRVRTVESFRSGIRSALTVPTSSARLAHAAAELDEGAGQGRASRLNCCSSNCRSVNSWARCCLEDVASLVDCARCGQTWRAHQQLSSKSMHAPRQNPHPAKLDTDHVSQFQATNKYQDMTQTHRMRNRVKQAKDERSQHSERENSWLSR